MKGLNPISGNFGMVQRFTVDSSNPIAIYKNTGVIRVIDGHIDGWDGAADTNFIGVARTIYDTNGVELNYLPASTAGYVEVYTDPLMQYAIESDTGIAEADRFATADLASYAGNTTTGESTAQISSTMATDDQFLILDILKTPTNDWADSNGDTENTIVIVVAALHFLKTMPAGITT